MRTERIPFDDMETFEHPQVRSSQLQQPKKGRFFDRWKLPEVEGDATRRIAPEDLDEPTLRAGTSASALLQEIDRDESTRREEYKETVLDMSESAPTLLRLPDRLVGSNTPAPPRTVGSSYVDTQENTTPTIVDEDFSRPLGEQARILRTESIPELDESALRDIRRNAPDAPWAQTSRPIISQRASGSSANLSTAPPSVHPIESSRHEQWKILGAAFAAFILVLTIMYVVFGLLFS